MKMRFPILGIVLIALLAISISSCDEERAGPMDPIVDAVVDTPPSEPVSPPSEGTVTPTTPTTPDGPIVSIAPAQISSPAVGAQLTVRVNIARAADVAGYDFTVGFDPTALRYVESANADYLPAGAFAAPAVASANSVRLTAASLTGAATANSGTLATVTFEVIAAKASTLQLSNVIISDSAGTLISATAQGGSVMATPTAEPVSPPVEPVAPTPDPVLPPASDGLTVSIAPAQTSSPAVGAQLTVSVNISGAADVAGYDFIVGFDSTALRYVESTNADYLPAGAFAAPAVASANSVRLTAVSFTGGVAADSGTLATVTFEVVAAKASALQLSNVIISDSAGTQLSAAAQDGTITAQ